jgi:hypothetical protein
VSWSASPSTISVSRETVRRRLAVEIEIGVLRSQCLDRRIDTQEQLESEIAAWEHQRNASGARIKWMFTTDKARAKMGRAYPQPASVCETKSKSHNHCAAILAALAVLAHARIVGGDLAGFIDVVRMLFHGLDAAVVNGFRSCGAATIFSYLGEARRCKRSHSEPQDKPRQTFFRCHHHTSPGPSACTKIVPAAC